jgi:hypothetical protein
MSKQPLWISLDGNAKVPVNHQIRQTLQCAMCIAEMPDDGTTWQMWGRMEVGFTKWGLQVWCARHSCNIIHIDFQGYEHPCNTHREETH